MLNVCFNKVVCFDVDDTLVYQNPPKHYSYNADVVMNWNGQKIPLWIHQDHVKRLKELKSKGYGIIVWSQQGNDWATCVINAIGLFNFVDFAITKPEECYDDLPFTEWTTRQFIGESND